jgi:polynucleotide 5'-hydroxyl-kinase GRC3/NOL9
MIGRLEDFIIEDKVVKEICKPRNKLIMVIGDADTGKTTFIEYMADFLAKQTILGIVDLDMGQSHIGLPTTIAWGKIKGGFKSWPNIKVEDFYYTGTLSPVGNLLQVTVGAKLITDRAASFCEKVIIDTTGLISEPIGRVLKQFKIDLLLPDIIIALEISHELRHILNCYQAQKLPKIFILSVPAQVNSKSITKRTQYRYERFKSYFMGAQTIEVSYENVGLRFTKGPIKFSTAELKDRIIAFRDEKNRDIALGIIRKANFKKRKLYIRSPINKKAKFSTLVIGETQIEL